MLQRIATFNVNSIRSRLDPVLTWLHTHQPDVMAVQETKVTDDLFPVDAFEAIGYTPVFRGQKSYNGVALLCRTPPNRVTCGFSDAGPTDETRLICAEFPDWTLVNTYVPQGRAVDHPMYKYKIEWFARLRKWFNTHFSKEDPLLWVGDMNVAHAPIDVHNPEQRAQHVCYHKDARAAFKNCRKWGFIDTFRLHHPEAGHYTFFDYRNHRNLDEGKGWRIDYILATAPLAQRCVNAYIDLAPRRAPRPSDHTVLVAEFD